MSSCRSCHAEITWVTTAAGTRMPIDPKPTARGNVDLVWVGGKQVAVVLGPADVAAAQIDGHDLYRSHFATCPDAASFRQ